MDVAEVELAVRALPEHEAGEAHLSRGPDDQVGIGAVVGVEILVHGVGGEGADDLVGAFPAGEALPEVPFDRIHDLLPAAVPHPHVQEHPLVLARGRLRRPERLEGPGREQVQPADRAHAHPEPLSQAALDPLGHLRLDHLEDVGDLAGLAREILGREPPERHRGDAQLGAPGEHLLGFLRSHAVPFGEARQAGFPRVAPVAVLDQAHVLRERPVKNLAQELALVEAVEEALQHQSRTGRRSAHGSAASKAAEAASTARSA